MTEILGTKFPIIQGGMHYVGYAQMAAAVSNAGGLGIITSLTLANTPADQEPHVGHGGAEKLRMEIRKCKSLTDKPFGVNVTKLPMIAPGNLFGDIVQVLIDEEIPVVETAGSQMPAEWKAFKENGMKIVHKCTSIRHALSAERAGVDAISMDGFDCGGHPGEDDVGNWVLLAKAGKNLKIPFVASGGVACGEQLAAAIAFGAEGINMGTRFMATKEAPVHQNIKQALVDTDERGTHHVYRSMRNTERVFKNETTMKVNEIEKEHPGDFSKIAHLAKGLNYKASFQETGDTTSSVWSCGQSIGLIDDVPTCQQLVENIMKEYEVARQRLVGGKL